ncbi:MAG TPA: ABC transporter ATP-binding protein [Firmicutes bacterium]|jgi:ABC-type lipoprotein export system ATPase subunit|nr:ABC transporter ATP-binding protein [Bacillota bacterium]
MILKAYNLVKEYTRGNQPFEAVNNVSLEIREGEFVCLAGRSGSGKSTLLNILAGLLTPNSGKIYFEGKDYETLDDLERSYLRNTKFGYIMQGQSAFSNLTVLQNVILPYTLFKRDGDPYKKALALLDRVGLRHLASQYPATLSGGEKRRVSIVRALLTSPKLLIADEPTGDLDEETTREVMELFVSAVKEGTAVLMVTHDMNTTPYGASFITMKAGRIEEKF